MAVPNHIHESMERASQRYEGFKPAREIACRKHGEDTVETQVSCDPRVLKVCIHCGLEA